MAVFFCKLVTAYLYIRTKKVDSYLSPCELSGFSPACFFQDACEDMIDIVNMMFMDSAEQSEAGRVLLKDGV